MNLLISAGEASGDLHGARLLEALKRRRPDLSAFGMGGERLERAGLQRIVRSENLSVVGVFEVFEKLPALWKGLAKMRSASRRLAPDAAVLIDFPDFNGILARRLHRDGVPIVYYVSPQVWAWRAGRARSIARLARRIVTLFPFEAEIYRRLGADAVCAGHPLVDSVREALESEAPSPHRKGHRLVLLPGSRVAEVRRHWVPMLDAAQALARRFDLDVAVVRAPGLPERLFPGASELGFPLIDTGRHALIASADLAFVASGTATLETALCGTPMVVVYRTSAASFAIGKRLVKVPWISLVNIVAGEGIVPELIQEQFHAARLEKEGAALLGSPEELAKMRFSLARVARQLGPPGGSERAADAVLEVLEPEERRRSAGP
ncbi:MAG TPA: lipid-A-disaccharide synthase [Thermoanaerobaculia bacterium]